MFYFVSMISCKCSSKLARQQNGHRIVNSSTTRRRGVKLFCSIDKNVMEDINNQEKVIMEHANKMLPITKLSDWYSVSKQSFVAVGGEALLIKHGNSLSELLKKIYPQYNWLPWKFTRSTKHFWDNMNNQRLFLLWAAKELKIKEISDWYSVTTNDIENLGGSTLIQKHNSSLLQLLSAHFPDYDWLPWKFVACPRNYWNDNTNQKKFILWAEKELNIKEKSDWYKIRTKDFFDIGGASLLNLKYNGSLFTLLSTLFPEYKWLPWRFHYTPKKYWKDRKNIVQFLEWAGKELGVVDLNDWYKKSIKDIRNLVGYSLFEEIGSIPHLLARAYPDIINPKSNSPYFKKTQYLLKTMLNTMLVQKEVFEDFKHPDVKNSSGHSLELDFYYPQLNLAVEYHGHQHYNISKIFNRHGNPIDENKQRDLSKIDLCKNNGITLIEIPYWWDRKYESLAATIYLKRPDLFTTPPTYNPIPLTLPSKTDSKKMQKDKRDKVALMTATEWKNNDTMDPTGWWMSEKYDGMRLYWDGANFYSRQGNKVNVPVSILNQMPTSSSLDGELWSQYGLYQDAVNLSKTDNEEKWTKASYWVFDAPHMKSDTYEERIRHLKSLKQQNKLPSFVNIIEPIKCQSKEHLHKYFESIVEKGGEGVMLNEPQSLYKPGRSSSLRKYKPFFDTEVKVIENNYPHGLTCEQKNGKHIFVGLSGNYEEAKSLKRGTVITVKYNGENIYGTIQYPKFYRERTDILWKDIINSIS